MGFLSLIFLTEPQDNSMHLSRADSEASPAVSRCQKKREFSVRVGEGREWRMEETEHQLRSPRQLGDVRGKLGICKGTWETSL